MTARERWTARLEASSTRHQRSFSTRAIGRLVSKSPAQRAYEAYVRAFPGEAGRLARLWDALPSEHRECWEAVAEALGQGRTSRA